MFLNGWCHAFTCVVSSPKGYILHLEHYPRSAESTQVGNCDLPLALQQLKKTACITRVLLTFNPIFLWGYVVDGSLQFVVLFLKLVHVTLQWVVLYLQYFAVLASFQLKNNRCIAKLLQNCKIRTPYYPARLTVFAMTYLEVDNHKLWGQNICSQHMHKSGTVCVGNLKYSLVKCRLPLLFDLTCQVQLFSFQMDIQEVPLSVCLLSLRWSEFSEVFAFIQLETFPIKALNIEIFTICILLILKTST